MLPTDWEQQLRSLHDLFPTMLEDELFELYKSYIHKMKEPSMGGCWYDITTAFDYEFPECLGFSCYDIGELLKKKGVVTKGVKTDHEHSCCYFYFKTKNGAERFAQRLAKFIIQRRAVANEWGLLTGEGTFAF